MELDSREKNIYRVDPSILQRVSNEAPPSLAGQKINGIRCAQLAYPYPWGSE